MIAAEMACQDKARGVDVATSNRRTNDANKAQIVDTVSNDEGLHVLANYTGDPNWDEAEERKILRMIDWKLMPVLCLTYGLQYYDKAMLSQAVCLLS